MPIPFRWPAFAFRGAPPPGVRASTRNHYHAGPARYGRAVVVTAAVLAAFPTAARAQSLDATEKKITAYIDAHAEDAVALLEKLVNINSGTLNPEGVRMVADVLAPRFEAIGFDVRFVPLPDSLERAGHLVAVRKGTSGKRILMIGHLDTVFEKDSPFQRFTREDSIAAGPGVTDMKGGDVVILQALEALANAGALDDRTITVVLTGDEERPGHPLSVARAALIEAGKRSDAALGFESGSRGRNGDYAVIGRRSASGWDLTVTGHTAHSSGVFSEGVGAGAIYEASRILHEFYEQLGGEKGLTFNPGVILGGSDVAMTGEAAGRAAGKTNIVAGRVIVQGDIRTLTDAQLERAREAMRRIVLQHLPGTDAHIEFREGYPSMPANEGNAALLATLDSVSRALGYGPIKPFPPERRGAADVSFVAPFTSGLGGLGPHGRGSHTAEETLNLNSLPRAAKRAALLVYRLTRE